MITTEGKLHIKRYLAGIVPSISNSIHFGIGGKAEAVGDITLHFEVESSDITVISYDFTNDKLVFKASIPTTLAGKVYEAALFAGPPRSGSKLLTTFDSDTETWVTGGGAPTFDSTNTRIGIDSLRLTQALSTTSTSVMGDIAFDLSNNAGSDKFVIAFNNTNTNLNTLVVRFKTDVSNYYTLTITNPASGYVIAEVLKSAATVTGSPSWASITSIEIAANSKAAGSSTVDLDAIRIEGISYIEPGSVMVSRELQASPFTKTSGKVQEMEFSLDVSIT